MSLLVVDLLVSSHKFTIYLVPALQVDTKFSYSWFSNFEYAFVRAKEDDIATSDRGRRNLSLGLGREAAPNTTPTHCLPWHDWNQIRTIKHHTKTGYPWECHICEGCSVSQGPRQEGFGCGGDESR
jgi:hypothetical protein